MSRPIRILALIPLALNFLLLSARAEDGKQSVRVICPTPPADQQEVFLASRDDEGAWTTFHTIEVRGSIITDWIQVPVGEIAFCVRQDEQLDPKATFTIKEDSPRLLAILVPGEKDDQLFSHLIDAKQLAFGKGKLLALNTTSSVCTVKLGTVEAESKPGEPLVQAPGTNEDGMFQFTVSYKDAEGKPVICYDRFVRNTESSRKFIFILPDPDTDVNVLTLPDFGPF